MPNDTTVFTTAEHNKHGSNELSRRIAYIHWLIRQDDYEQRIEAAEHVVLLFREQIDIKAWHRSQYGVENHAEYDIVVAQHRLKTQHIYGRIGTPDQDFLLREYRDSLAALHELPFHPNKYLEAAEAIRDCLNHRLTQQPKVWIYKADPNYVVSLVYPGKGTAPRAENEPVAVDHNTKINQFLGWTTHKVLTTPEYEDLKAGKTVALIRLPSY
jgi:hypothetical protein